MSEKTNIYFASDFHLGSPNEQESLLREKRVIQWLDAIKNDAKEIYLVGDIFDFWFEYKHSIPKGFSRFIGKIAELADSGTSIYFFTGNHDMWMFDYFEKELGVTIHRKPIKKQFGNKTFYIGHGDGLGPGDNGYKFVKKIFANKFCQWLFARIHPNLGMSIAKFWSNRSREHNNDIKQFLGEEKEWLVSYCKDILKQEHVDVFIFGHRHLPIQHQINQSIYINLGEWMNDYSYAKFDGEKIELLPFGKS
ncbi:MAG: UDP-2,3-diacylglucosamine diphosphatase [Bacteroidia bacterium]